MINHMHEALKKKMFEMKSSKPALDAHSQTDDKAAMEENKGDEIAGAAPSIGDHEKNQQLLSLESTPNPEQGDAGPMPDHQSQIMKGKMMAHEGEPMEEGMFGKISGHLDDSKPPQGLREHAMHAMHKRIMDKKKK